MLQILVADDNSEILFLVEAILEEAGFKVYCAGNGVQALALARQHPPDLLITDILMPMMDGFALCRDWKADPKLKGIPLIFYTATYTDVKDRALAMSLGADRFVVKPQPPEVFLSIVREVLGQRGAVNAPNSPAVPIEEHEYLKSYNHVLIHKLEDKMAQLQRANYALEQDIAERKRGDECYRRLVELSPDAIYILCESRIVFANSSGVRLLGAFNPESILGKPILEFVHADDRPEFSSRLELVGRDLKDSPLTELKILRLDGVVIETEGGAIPFIHNQQAAVQMTARDISARKKLDAQFLRAQRMETIGALASGIAHDLNNVMTPILMTLPFVREKCGDPDALKMLDSMEMSVERGANIVKQLLTFARGVSGQRTIIQPRHLIRDIAKIAEETFPKTIEIATRFHKKEWCLVGDPTQLHQVLLNLCVNARDAMPNGGQLVLSLDNEEVDACFAGMHPNAKPGSYIAMLVADSGEGIAPEIMDHIFEPFFTTKEPGKGTGLGLPAVMNIVRSHDGFVQVFSETGKGSQFKVFLPAAPHESVPAACLSAPVGNPPRGHEELILVVDDELDILNVTQGVLVRNGYQALPARNGAEAIATFTHNQDRIAVVIADMVMPIMDGVTALKAIRQINSRIPLIATSGMVTKEMREQMSQIEGITFIPKPFTTKQLLDSLRLCLEKASH